MKLPNLLSLLHRQAVGGMHAACLGGGGSRCQKIGISKTTTHVAFVDDVQGACWQPKDKHNCSLKSTHLSLPAWADFSG